MQNKHPGEVQQKALPVCVYRELHRLAILQKSDQSHLDESIAWILTLAYFWCMRSYEYLDVQGEHRTKILCIRNFRFFNRHNKDISTDLNLLSEATTVSITFEFQKRNVRNDTISHQKSGDKLNSGEMCPVRAAAEVIKRIHSYNIPKEQIRDTPINFENFGSINYTIPSSLFLIKIRAAVKGLGH
jgi:hypothetical protein